MTMKKTLRRLLALLLPVLLLLATAHIPAAAKNPAVLRVAILSDPHFYLDEMTGGFCEAFREDNLDKGRPAELAETLFLSALADLKKRVKQENLEYLLVPGDLTRDGEYAGHARVAQLLRQFEKESGVPVAVIPGNHDVNKGNAADFSSGERREARNLKPEEFLEFYAKLGYDLPGCERFGDTLSYIADLGRDYRLIAIDTSLNTLGGGPKCSLEDLCDWVIRECGKAKAAGKTIVGMGHHNLAEQIGCQEAVMHNFGFEGVREIGEAFADAGMHFYLSGHLHLGEIAMQVSDSGEPLYDITTASTAGYPGETRTVKFSTSGGKTQADVRSNPVPLNVPAPFPADPYYATLFGRTFGGTDGGGMGGYLKERVGKALTDMLRDMMASGGIEGLVKDQGVDLAPLNLLFRYLDKRLLGQPERITEALGDLIDEAFALPISKLPCARFIGKYGFGDPDKPGTVEDLANCGMVYMFGKEPGAADDPFVQDVLRRVRNGEFVDQVLNFAVPKILAALGGDVLPLLMNNPAAIRALERLADRQACPLLVMPLLALVVSPGKREALSASLHWFASGVVSSQSPTGSRDGKLVYDGPIEVPTDPGTFRLPQELNVAVKGLGSAEITWYTRQSVRTPELSITDKEGNPTAEVKISIESQPEDLLVEQIDIGFTKLLGRVQPALKHTARLTGLQPGKAYRFTAGDGKFEWYSEPQAFDTLRDNPVTVFFRQLWDQVRTWFGGLRGLLLIWLENTAY